MSDRLHDYVDKHNHTHDGGETDRSGPREHRLGRAMRGSVHDTGIRSVSHYSHHEYKREEKGWSE